MRVAHHTAVVVLVCSLGGLGLAGALASGYRDIDGQTRDLGQNSVALRDISHLETLVAQWFVTVDLVFYQGETYLVSGARDQAANLLTVFEGLRGGALGRHSAPRIDAAAAEIRAIDQLIERAGALGGENRDSLLSGLTGQVDEHSGGLVEAIEATSSDMRERSERLTGDLEEQRERLGSMAIALGLAYVGGVFAVWRWASVTVVRPLARLTAASLDGNIADSSIHGEARGPSEVRQLTASIHSYAERLTASAKKVEAANEELSGTLRELQETQAQLVQTEKMASVGQLAAGVAHEINNPLGFIVSNLNSLGGYVEDIKRALSVADEVIGAVKAGSPEVSAKVEEADRVREEVDLDYVLSDIDSVLTESIEGADRVRKIVADLRDFSHVDSPDVTEADVNELLEKALSVAANELKYKAEVVRDLGDVPAIPCFGGQLSQVLLNLLVNAAQAIEDRGTVTVRSGHGGGHVWVEIADTGCGIAEENLSNIFDPFFTTKAVGSGTGLGLHLSFKIIEAHGGRISVDSKVGQGATFRIELPMSGPPETKEGKVERAA